MRTAQDKDHEGPAEPRSRTAGTGSSGPMTGDGEGAPPPKRGRAQTKAFERQGGHGRCLDRQGTGDAPGRRTEGKETESGEKQRRKWERLSEDLGLYIGKDYGFTMDTLLLADFSQPKAREICGEFGTGCGAIPILWQLKTPPRLVYGVEIQKAAADQARASVIRNGLSEQIKILHGDIRRYKELLPHQGLNRIACNPPYKAKGAGPVSPNPARSTARHEAQMTPEDIVGAAAYALSYGGSLCVCQRPERLTDFLLAFRAGGIEPKRLQLVQQHLTAAPSLFLLEGRRGGKPGLRIEPVRLVRERMRIWG